MAGITAVSSDDTSARDDACMCLWGQNLCPNEPMHIVVERGGVGYSVMCDPHKAAFVRTYPELAVNVEPYLIARARELRALCDQMRSRAR